MRQSYLRRPLSVVLSLLMVIGLFTVCGFGAMAKQTAESAVIQSWDANALGEAASTEQNSHEKPIYEMTGDVIGRRVVDKGGDFLFHSAYFAMSKIKVGDKLTATIRIFFNSEAFGNDVPLEYQWVGDDANFQKTLFNKIQYTSAPLLTDATYGYQYKELTGEYTITAADMPAGKEQFQLRAFLNGDEDANAYSIKVTNTNTGEVLIDRQGADFHTLGGITNPNPEMAQMYPVIDENNPYLASYSGPEKHTARTTEPYASINTDGMDGNAVLLNTLGAKLEEGRYAFIFNMASQYSLGEKKVTYAAMDGEKELASQLITLQDVNATVGADSRIFEDRVLPFTVDAESAGKDITFQVTLHNETDYYLRSVTLVKYFDPVTLSGKDLADAAKAKGVPYEGYYTTEGNTVIGMTASATPWEIFWDKETGPLADTVSAGDKIRVEVDMGTVHDEIPGGSHMGNLAVRTDNEEEQRFVSAATEYPAATYNALELKTDDTYGYKYRTVSAEITMPSDNAAAIEAIANNGLVVLYNNAQYTMNTKLPRSVYRLEITNETTGKTLYKLTGADLKNYMFDGANATPIIAGSEIEAYGSKVTGGADWWAYVNLYTGPIEGVDDGDLIVAYSKVWYPTGTFTGGGTNLNAGMKIDGGWKAGSLIDAQNDLDSYTKAETKVDPTYGCQYKELPIQKRHEVIEGKDTLVESKVPEGGGAQIAADGLQILFGGTGNNFAVNPMEVYGLSLQRHEGKRNLFH